MVMSLPNICLTYLHVFAKSALPWTACTCKKWWDFNQDSVDASFEKTKRAFPLTSCDSKVTRRPSLAIPSSFSSLRCGHSAKQKARAIRSISRLCSAESLVPSLGRSPLWRKNTCTKHPHQENYFSVISRIINFCTSVQRMIFPFSLYSDFWNIFVLLMDSIDFPSMELITLCDTYTLFRTSFFGKIKSIFSWLKIYCTFTWLVCIHYLNYRL